MEIICIIDNLTAGGAQRQLCMLAILLRKNGHNVKVLTYHPQDFFLPILQQAEVDYHCVQTKNPIRRLFHFRSLLRNGSQNVVIAFLRTPSLIAEFAAFPYRKWGLIVSERNALKNGNNFFANWRRFFHLLADYITVNSYTNQLYIENTSPWLKDRLVRIYNCVDFDVFNPPSGQQPYQKTIRLLAVGKFSDQKNILGFIDAVGLARKMNSSLDIIVNWYGDAVKSKDPNESIYEQARKKIQKHGLEAVFKLHPPVNDLASFYRQSSALVLPSFYEGLPNVVCEAMACGLPILMSNVCDSKNLVTELENGLLFSPESINEMADALIRFSEIPFSKRTEMGEASREKALSMFNAEKYYDNYLQVIEGAVLGKKANNLPGSVVAKVSKSELRSTRDKS